MLQNTANAQVDNKFWFVAPEISNDHGDRPIYFNITTFDQPANVTISMPANNSFGEIILSIDANSTHRENVTPHINVIENRYRTDYDPAIPGKNNNGILIESDVDITVYYESASPVNSDLFALKGRNALGSHFFTPFQTRYYNNSGSNWDDPAYSAFDIVFAEDNTYITLDVPAGKAVYNNGTGWTGTVRLGPFNRGETFSGIPVWMTFGVQPSKNGNDLFGRVAQDHLSGVEIQAHDISGTRTKRIAVTIKDDSMRGFKGSAYDTGGDQIVPIDIIGKEYIALKGELREGNVDNHYSRPPAPSWARQEAVFVLATENNTQLTVRGTNLATMNKGETYTLELEHDFTHILASAPVYVWQVTGFGDEMGAAILPAIDRCTGSNEVAFTRSQTGWDFYLTILVRKGAEGSFLLNGTVNSILNASSFQNVTGTSFWKAAVVGPVSNSDVLELQQNTIENTADLFHVGIIMGSGSGCRYGYFSDFGETPQIDGIPTTEGVALCAGAMELKVTDESAYPNYQWYKDGQQLLGENAGTYLVQDPGRYKVTAITTCNGVTTETFPSNEIDAIPCISVNDPIVTEGTSNAIFTIKISDRLPVNVRFEYETLNGTATKTKDYVSGKGTAIINAGADSTTILVPVVQDNINEPDELFNLVVRNATNVNISDSIGTCTIKDDGDAEPFLNIPEVLSVVENIGDGKVTIPFKLSNESGYTVEADYKVVDITAENNEDYQSSPTGSISFAPGETSKNISIDIFDDSIYEPTTTGYESFAVGIENLNHAIAGVDSSECRIVENEGTPDLSVLSSTANEGDTLIFNLNLTHACSENIQINVEALDNTASLGLDYEYPPGIQTFILPAGEVSASLKIPATEDLISEGNETFTLRFSNPVNANIPSSPIQVSGTITDSDGLPQVYVDDVSATEGDTLQFILQLSHASSFDNTCDAEILFGSASLSDIESIPASFPVEIKAGSNFVRIKIPTQQDTEEEGNEDLQLKLYNLSGDAAMLDSVATGTIIDDDNLPVANDDVFGMNEDAGTSLNTNITNNDNLGDPPTVAALVSDALHGTLTLNADGSFSYLPEVDYHGADMFSYSLTDSDNDQDTATVVINIHSVNDIPEVIDDSYSIQERTSPNYTPLSGNILLNDTGLGDTVSIVQLSNPTMGNLTLAQDGSFTYEPNEQEFGEDQFTYKLRDKDNDESDIATAAIKINYYNDAAPAANNDNYSTPENTTMEIAVFSNDTDIDGNATIDKKSIHITEQPQHGSLLSDMVTGKLTYTPDAGYNGSDSFKYTIADVKIGNQPVKRSAVSTVFIEITTDNSAPVAICNDISVYLDESGLVSVSAVELDNGSHDPDIGDNLTFSIEGESQITYDCSSKGINTVDFMVTDDHLASNTCTAQITVLDTISPNCTNCKKDTVVYCGPLETSRKVYYNVPRFSDNCDGDNLSGILNQGVPSGSSFTIGETTVQYTYVDEAGNDAAKCKFIVKVIQDNEKPVITDVSDATVTVSHTDYTYVISGTALDPEATDNTGIASLKHDYGMGGTTLDNVAFPEGEHEITWTATDIFGNMSTKSFQLSVSPRFNIELTSDKSGNEVCKNHEIVFYSNITGGTAPFQFSWLVDDIDVTGWINEDYFGISSLSDGQIVKVKAKDSEGYEYTSTEITVTVLPVPISGSVYRQPNN